MAARAVRRIGPLGNDAFQLQRTGAVVDPIAVPVDVVAVADRVRSLLQQQLEKAGVQYEIEIYSGAPHAFTVFGPERYQERAEELSWQAFLSFMQRQLAQN